MKKLLLLLFVLYCNNIYSQGGFSLNTSSAAYVNSPVLAVASGSYFIGRTYVIFLATTAATNPTDNPTISAASGMSLIKRGTIAGGNRRIIVYSFFVTSTATQSMTFTYAESQISQFFVIYVDLYQGVYRLPSVVSSSGVSANPLITMPNTKSSNTIGMFMNNTNSFGGTAESGWSSTTFAYGGALGGYAVFRNLTTDNTINVTASSSDWIGLGIQFSYNRKLFTY